MVVKIGKKIFIGLNIWIDPLFPEYIYINDYAEIGDKAFIYAHSRESIPLLKINPLMVKKVVIGKGVWVGEPNVTILPGVKIGDYSIIAAGAVVNKNVPSGVLVGGVPIKIIKHLNINTLKDN